MAKKYKDNSPEAQERRRTFNNLSDKGKKRLMDALGEDSRNTILDALMEENDKEED
jgi:hypothetical protein